MKRFINFFCIAICAFMLLGALASCKKEEPTPTPDGSESQTVLDSGSDSQGGNEGDGDPDPDPDPDPEPVLTTVNATLMTFNIRYYNGESGVEVRHWNNRKDAVCDFILNSGAGIIGLNEVKANQFFDLRDGVSEKYDVFWYASYVDDSNPQGNGVAYDRSIWQLVGTPEHFWLSPTPDVPSTGWKTSHYRSCIKALFEHKETGVRINVFVTHLDHKYQEDMVNGAKLILERMGESEYPVYLCGDFNCTPDSAAYNEVAAKLQDAQRTALDSDEGSTFNGWGSKTDADKYIIDFCFFSKENVTVKSYEICDGKWGENNENLLSDHNPVRVNVDLSAVAFKYPDISGVGGVEDFDDADKDANDY